MFADNSTARPLPPGTVPASAETPRDGFETGDVAGKLLDKAPANHAERELNLPDLKSLVERGQERFNIFCSPCHGRVGDGNGMIAQRGLADVKRPANFHDQRLIDVPDGYIFQVITNGHGRMFSYRARVPVPDRWAIVTYIRALQLSEGGRP